MKLFVQEKVFSIGDKFSVKDEYGNDRYFVKGEVLSIGKKRHIYDYYGQELALISERLFTLTPKFRVIINNAEVATIAGKITLIKPKYVINGLDWEIVGSVMCHDFSIMQNGICIATIHKQWMSWGDCYEIDIADGVNEVLVVGVVLALDAVHHRN